MYRKDLQKTRLQGVQGNEQGGTGAGKKGHQPGANANAKKRPTMRTSATACIIQGGTIVFKEIIRSVFKEITTIVFKETIRTVFKEYRSIAVVGGSPRQRAFF